MTPLKDALLEIGCEELPASFVPMGMKQLQSIAQKSLLEHHLTFKATHVYGTPRRLAICIQDLAGHSPDQERRPQGRRRRLRRMPPDNGRPPRWGLPANMALKPGGPDDRK